MHSTHIMKMMNKNILTILLALVIKNVSGQNEGIPAPLVADNNAGADHHCIWYDKCGPDPGKQRYI